MTQEEVMKIIDRLKSGYRFNRFEEKGVLQEFIRVLIRCNYTIANRAVDALLRTDTKDSPSIAALMKAYDDHLSHNKTSNYRDVVNKEYCDVCDDKGFVEVIEFKTAYLHGEATKNPYKYYPPCPYCEKGTAFAIKGELPLTYYLDDAAIKEIRRKNREKRVLADERAGIQQRGA